MASFPPSGTRTVIPPAFYGNYMEYWESPYNQDTWRVYEYVGPAIPAGDYVFYGTADNGIMAYLNGVLLLEQYDYGTVKSSGKINIPAGNNSLMVHSLNQGGPGWTMFYAMTDDGHQTPISTAGSNCNNWRR